MPALDSISVADIATVTKQWTAESIIQRPLRLVDEIFAHLPHDIQSQQHHSWSVPAVIQQSFALPSSLSLSAPVSSASLKQLIPSLNVTMANNALHTLPHQSLVRYHGQVTDVTNPELYTGVYHSQSSIDSSVMQRGTGKYRDLIEVGDSSAGVDFNHSENVRMERLTVKLLPILCESQWVKALIDGPTSVSTSVGVSQASTSSSGSARKKRALSDTEDDSAMATETTTISAEATKRNRSDATDKHNGDDDDDNGVSTMSDANAVMATLYDANLNALKVGDLVEVIGVYTLTPALMTDDDDDIDSSNQCYSHPRIHVTNIIPINFSESPSFLIEAVDGARQSLLSSLIAVCDGDALAGEMLLLSLISRVHSRSPQLIGTLPINIQTTNTELVDRLTTTLSQLCVNAVPVKMTLEILNGESFIPVKDYTTDRLSTSLLQSHSNTVFVIDETVLTQGKLTSIGMRNVSSLQSMIDDQKLAYDFKYHNIELNVDVNFVSVSQRASILKNMYGVKLLPSAHTARDSGSECGADSESLYDSYRRYLYYCRSLSFSIDAALSSTIEQDFIARRKANNAIQAAWLNEALIVARCLSISHGKCQLDQRCWQDACEIVDARLARV